MKNLIKFHKNNITLALTNINFLFPFFYCYFKGLSYLQYLILNAAFWSIVYHLYKNHKHGMGLEIHNKTLSKILQKIDTVSAFLLIFYSLIFLQNKSSNEEHLYIVPYLIIIMLINNPIQSAVTVICFYFLFISERCKDNETNKYVYFHSAWHLVSFLCLWLWLIKVVV